MTLLHNLVDLMPLSTDQQRHHPLRHKNYDGEGLFLRSLKCLVNIGKHGLGALILLLHLHVKDLDVSAVEIRDGEIRVEANVLHLMRSSHAREPLLQASQFAQHVIVDIDLKAEDLALLERQLQSGIGAAALALFIAASLK
jgi:hypothetical protein